MPPLTRPRTLPLAVSAVQKCGSPLMAMLRQISVSLDLQTDSHRSGQRDVNGNRRRGVVLIRQRYGGHLSSFVEDVFQEYIHLDAMRCEDRQIHVGGVVSGQIVRWTDRRTKAGRAAADIPVAQGEQARIVVDDVEAVVAAEAKIVASRDRH